MFSAAADPGRGHSGHVPHPPPPHPTPIPFINFITFRAAFYNNSCTLALPIDIRTHELYYCTISRAPRYAIIPPPPPKTWIRRCSVPVLYSNETYHHVVCSYLELFLQWVLKEKRSNFEYRNLTSRARGRGHKSFRTTAQIYASRCIHKPVVSRRYSIPSNWLVLHMIQCSDKTEFYTILFF